MKLVWILGFMALLLTAGMDFFFLSSAMKTIFKPLNEAIYPEPEEEEAKFWSFRSREIEQLVEDLKKRQIEITKKEKTIKEMEAVLDSEKKELELAWADARAEIETKRKDLMDKLIFVEESEEANLDELAVTYANMAPETVVEIFKGMEDVFVVKILTFMEPDIIAPIFQAMVNTGGDTELSTKRVVRLTELMRLRGKKV